MFDKLNSKVPPALLLFFMVVLLWLLPASPLFPVTWLKFYLVLALVVGAFAACVIVAAVIAFRQHKTTLNPMDLKQASTLLDKGIFAYSRNPIYLGFVLLLIALGLVLNSLWTLFITPLFIAYLTVFQIIPEEQALAQKFGFAYQLIALYPYRGWRQSS